MMRSSFDTDGLCPGRPKSLCLCSFVLVLLGFVTCAALRASAAPRAGVSLQPEPVSAEPVHAAWTVITSTTGAYPGSGSDEPCMVITPTGVSVVSASARVFVPVFEGAPVSASLVITTCGVRAGQRHSIYVNGQRVAGVYENLGTTCFCGSGRSDSYPISPSLVFSGWNVISITNDANLGRGWTAYAPKLVVAGDLSVAIMNEFSTAPNRWASYQVPIGYDPGQSRPLLVAVGATFGDKYHGIDREYRQEVLLRFAQRASQRGWLLLAPAVRESWLREQDVRIRDYRGGGRTASQETQHDFINAIEYMKAHYNVDASRIYISGYSSGGGAAATIAAKYPDVFAAVVDWGGPMDILQYGRDRALVKGTMIDYDFGCSDKGDNKECASWWHSRAAVELRVNLMNVPMAVVHGLADVEVPVTESVVFRDAMAGDFDLETHNKKFIFHTGGCTDTVEGFDELDWMSQFSLNACPTSIKIRSEEDKSYYWVAFHQREWNGNTGYIYSQVEASYDPMTKVISATIGDQRAFMDGNLPVDVDFNLKRLAECYPGLDPGAEYTVESYNPSTGDYVLYRHVVPVAGRLTVSVERDSAKRGVPPLYRATRQFLIYPHTAPELITATLQQGVSPSSAYDGVEDTYVDLESPTSNYATAGEFLMTYNGGKSALLKFDLGSIPPNAIVKSAHLNLYLTQSMSPILEVNVHEMLQPWSVTQATWQQASAGQPWGTAGVTGAGIDYALKPVDTFSVLTRGYYVFNVASLFPDWLSGANQGLLIAGPRREGSGSVWYHFASSEASTLSQRPKLVIEYMLRSSEPTPTSTATPSTPPSRSPTPTDTPTATSTSTVTPSGTVLASATPTDTPLATATPTATPIPTGTPTASPAATATLPVTATHSPTSGPTLTPTTVGARCVRWDSIWHDEFENPALPLWHISWGQGAGTMQGSILNLVSGGSSDRFPLLWAQVPFPAGDYAFEVRFQYGTPTSYGTGIGMGSTVYDGQRYEDGALPTVGVEDVLGIYQSSSQFRVSLFRQVDWFGPLPDTRWHVVRVLREGATYVLSVDGRRIGSVSRRDKAPVSMFLGSPATMFYPGPWTPLFLDYARVAECGVIGADRIWLPMMLRTSQ